MPPRRRRPAVGAAVAPRAASDAVSALAAPELGLLREWLDRITAQGPRDASREDAGFAEPQR
jgi:hypothetical protein